VGAREGLNCRGHLSDILDAPTLEEALQSLRGFAWLRPEGPLTEECARHLWGTHWMRKRAAELDKA
jgi:hypothetical protein